MNKKKIALIGNPNVGKSTLFNELTKMHQHTGNWAGKTVGVAVGYHDDLEIYDLPGTYSLIPHSLEEEITSDFIIKKDYDLALIVCDATMLERNLNLVIQTLEVTNQAILCVNMIDETIKNGITIDIDKLSKLLHIPVVGISAKKKIGIESLLKEITNFNNNETFKVDYCGELEDSINAVSDLVNSRFEAIKCIIDDNIKDDKTCLVKSYLCDQGINSLDSVMKSIYKKCEDINNEVTIKNLKKKNNRKLDKILTNKITGIPIMILMLIGILYISIEGANYPSSILFSFFKWLKDILNDILLNICIPKVIVDLLINGVYQVLTWVVAVMLPPMAIFFPLFTLLEDLGVLPRIAFNLDGYFQKSNACGKQALTMCMGFGCNAVGVTNARIIDSPRERLIAILTNSFIPCNGRFPTLISVIGMFFIIESKFFNSIINVLILTLAILLSIFITFIVSKILSKTILKGIPSFFTLELPPYRKPQVVKVIVRSILDRTLFVLGRAVLISIPAGVIIWLCANITIGGETLISIISNFLDPFGKLIGLDGVIVLAFILGFPANEIVIPIIMMSYLSNSTIIDISNLNVAKDILTSNGWTITTAICIIIFILFHFPCSTTVLTIKKETGSLKWTILSFLLPLVIGISLCFIINILSHCF